MKEFSVIPTCNSTIPLKNKVDIDILHARLAHASSSKLKHLFSQFSCTDVQSCETCILAKQHKLPFERSDSIAIDVFDLVHIDLWGPYHTPSISGATYFLTVLDDHSRTTWLFLLENKQ